MFSGGALFSAASEGFLYPQIKKGLPQPRLSARPPALARDVLCFISSPAKPMAHISDKSLAWSGKQPAVKEEHHLPPEPLSTASPTAPSLFGVPLKYISYVLSSLRPRTCQSGEDQQSCVL